MKRKARQRGAREASRPAAVRERRVPAAFLASAVVDSQKGSKIARRALSAARVALQPTAFLRDPDALDCVVNQLLARIGECGRAGRALQQLRVWIPACATGEEAYSVAMLLLERIQTLGASCQLQVFATDADPGAVRIARRGIYAPGVVVRTVSVPRLKRFFTRLSSGGYQVREELRKVLAFGTHNLVIDTPFSRLDLICCRGALAGLSPDTWTRVVSWLHFGLKPDGLLLVSSEDCTGNLSESFEPVSEVQGVYRRIGARASVRGHRVELPRFRHRGLTADVQVRAPDRPPERVTLESTPQKAAPRLGKQRNEVRTLRAALGRALQELEAARTQFQTGKEETVVINEELRSTNEELRVTNEYLQDATETLERSQRELEERGAALQRTEEQLRAVLDATADGVITIAAAGQITMINRSAAELFGYTRQELIGCNVGTLMLPGERARHDAYLSRYERTRLQHIIGKPREVLAYRRDGSVFPAMLSVREVKHLSLFVGCIRDLTEDKLLQQEILNVATLEQQRIGQELHDGIQQELTGLGLLAQNLGEAMSGRWGGPEADLAKRLAAGIGEANRHIRGLARGLVATPVEAHALPAALGELARSTQETYKLHCRLEAAGAVQMPDASVATHLYRIAQEAVGNAVKHAQADKISIRLGQEGDKLILQVRDNGVGIRSPPSSHGGVGLRLMQHRCTLIGGQFDVSTQNGRGTIVSCVLPLAGRGLT